MSTTYESQARLEHHDEEHRQTGKTTRQIDEAIQALFKYGSVELLEHYPGSTVSHHVSIATKVFRRLQLEHSYKTQQFNQVNNIISIVDFDKPITVKV